MEARRVGFDHLAIALVAAGLAAPLVFVAGIAIGLTVAAAVVAGVIAGVALAIGLVRWLPAAADGALRGPAARILFCIVGLLAVARTAGLAIFMADTARPEQSVVWFDPLYIGNSCFSAY